MPSLYREKTKSATIRIMESIGSFYDVYIAMTGKANSKEAIYLESVTSELNKQLREVTSKVTETFGIFDKIFGGVGANISANLGHGYRDWETDRKSTRLNSSHSAKSRMPSSA